MSQLFPSRGQSIGASASASVLPMNIQIWFPLRFTALISLLSKRLSWVFSNTTVQKHEFFGILPSLWSSSHIHTWLLEWVSIFSSRVSSQSRDQSRVSCVSWIGRCILYYWAAWEALRLRNSPIIRELSDPHHPPPGGELIKGQWCNQSCPLWLSSVQLLSSVWLFAGPWTAAYQVFLSITNSWSLLTLMSIESVMSSNHLILCCPLVRLPSIFPSTRVFSNESVLHIRWPKYWSFSFSISPSNEYSGLISFRIDWLDLLAVQGTLKSLLQHHSSKASILWCSAFFMV